MTRRALDAALLAAHAADDRVALVGLYARAAEGAAPPAEAFYLTQAYIFALDTGHPDAPTLHRRLKAAGREA